MINQKKGFTLIELLIVIGIIGILAAAVIVVLNPAELLAQARDGQRLSDLDAVEAAVGLYMASVDAPELDHPATSTQNTVFYDSNALITCSGTCTDRPIFLTDGTGWVSVNLDAVAGGSPLPVLPTDPTNDANYGYVYAGNDTTNTFELNGRLESVRHRDKMDGDGGNDNGCASNGYTAADCWYEQGTNLSLL